MNHTVTRVPRLRSISTLSIQERRELSAHLFPTSCAQAIETWADRIHADLRDGNMDWFSFADVLRANMWLRSRGFEVCTLTTPSTINS